MHETSGVRADGTVERQSTTDGQTDVDSDSDEQGTTALYQYNHTDPTLDVAAVCWSDTAASTSTSRMTALWASKEAHPPPSTDGQMNVD